MTLNTQAINQSTGMRSHKKLTIGPCQVLTCTREKLLGFSNHYLRMALYGFSVSMFHKKKKKYLALTTKTCYGYLWIHHCVSWSLGTVNSVCLVITITLTHWGRVTHICVSKLTSIGSDNGLAPGWCQAIIWNNAGILLIGTLATNFSEIWENALENFICKMAAILSQPQCFKFPPYLQGQGWDVFHDFKCCDMCNLELKTKSP